MSKNKPIPPDPEGMNDERSEWAAAALVAFRKRTGTDQGDAVADLLADLMHYCDRHGMDFSHELARAEQHYGEETLPDEEIATDETRSNGPRKDK